MKDRLLRAWEGTVRVASATLSNPTVRRYLISSITTFLTTFSGFLVASLGALPASQAITGSFLLAIASAAIRAAWKAVVEGILGQHGDPAPVVEG